MAANKMNKDQVLQLIKEEAYIITRKRELYSNIKQIEDELKNLNECMGLAGKGLVGTFGFDGAGDTTKKASPTGFANPMSISHIEQLAKDMGIENPYASKGYGDEFSGEINLDKGDLAHENEILKQEIEQLKSALGNKQ